jgi:putative ABC transport system permease protein
MIGVALKGLAGRKVRALLTAFAVVIGVSMVSGTFVLTDTMQKAFDGIFTAAQDQTDAVVAGKKVVKSSLSGAAPVPESVLTRVRALPEVAAAGGTISAQDANKAEILGRDGKSVGGGNAPTFAVGYDATQSRFSPLRLRAGDWPRGPSQTVVDAGTAKDEHFRVGQPVDVRVDGQRKTFRITGLATLGNVDSLGGATMAVFDIPTAQALLHKQGLFDEVSIAAKDGTSPQQLIHAVQGVIPPSLAVQDIKTEVAKQTKDLNSGLDFIRYFLLGFGGIALFVGAFVIFNTLSITVAQRTREFATLRTLGGSRRQVMRSVVLEGFVIGVLASLIGLLCGLGIAKGMSALFAAIGADLPKAGTVFALRTVVISLLLGTSITVLASIMPALRATRVPPIAAVREGAALPESRLAKHSARLAIGVVAASVAAICLGVFANGLSAIGVGALLGGGIIALFLGIALAAPHLVKPLARLVGWPARRAGGVAGELAEANAVRNPSRTASTAAALMIGLTLVTVVAVLGAGLRSSVHSAISDQVQAAYVLDGNDGAPFAAAEGAKAASVPGVRVASQVRNDKARMGGQDRDVTGIEPATIGHFYRFAWTHGSAASLGQLGTNGALVTQDYADDHDLAVNSRLSIQTPSGARRELVVRGIYDPPAIEAMLGDVSIARATFDDAFPQPKNKYTFIEAGPGAEPALAAATKDLSDVRFHAGEKAFVDASTASFSSFLNLLYVLLAFSVVVSLFGMVNALVLSVFERTRELGMLRTIGMTRRQARRMIRHESVITALIGAALGLPLGIFLAALVTQALSEYDVVMSLPLGSLIGFTLVAVLAGVTAAVLPARRAARLNVLQALQYE